MDRVTRVALAQLNTRMVRHGAQPLTAWPANPAPFWRMALQRTYPKLTGFRLVPGEVRFWTPTYLHVGRTPDELTEKLLQAAS